MATYSALPATLNLVATVGNDFTLSLTVTENGSSWVATGATLATDIIDSSGAVVATDFTTAASTGSVSLSLTDTQTGTLGVGVYSYRLSVTKSSLTRDWIAGTLSIVEAGVGGSSTSSASLSISNSAVALGITSTVGAASNITVLDSAGYYAGDDVEEVLAEQATKFAFRKSALLMPGAPFQRVIASSPPTVAVNASSTITSGRSFTATPTSKYMTLCAGGNFLTDGPRYSASHVYPRTFPGRKYFSTLVGFDGTDIEFQLDSAPGHYYRFSYREAGQNEWRYVAESEVAGPGGGAIRYFKLTFSTAATRVVRMENTAADIRSLTIGQYDTCWAVPPRGPRCIVVGDSYVQSASAPPTGYSSIGSWVTSFADTLGWDDVWNSGLGGTGYIADGSYVDFNARAADDIIAFAPEVVVVYGGRNDFASGAAAIGTAAGSLFTALRAGLPTAILVVVGPNGSGSPTDGSRDTSTWGPIEDAIFSATASTADIQLEMMSSGIFTGTGNVSSPATGNQTNYIQSDGVHPSTAGARYLGQRIAYKLLAALPNI